MKRDYEYVKLSFPRTRLPTSEEIYVRIQKQSPKWKSASPRKKIIRNRRGTYPLKFLKGYNISLNMYI